MPSLWAPFRPPAPEAVSLLAILRDRDQTATGELLDVEAHLASTEGLGPYVGGLLARGRLRAAPGWHHKLLREYHRCLAAEGLVDGALEALSEALAPADIPVLCLKGAALARTVFRPGERSMSDVDVLVPPSRWHEALRILLSRGFMRDEREGKAISDAFDYARLLRSRGGVPIEVHRFLCERSLFEVDYDGSDGIFARASRVREHVHVPSPEDLFVSLAVHAAKHGLRLSLRSFVDGLRLIEQGSVDAARALTRASRWGARHATQAYLSVLASLAAPIRVADGGISGPRRALWWALGGLEGPETRPERVARLALLVDGPGPWFRYLAGRLVPAALDAAVQRLL